MEKPLVSVIVPTFNSEEFLATCLFDLEYQTYTNVEVIVVDNFSTDDTLEIATKYTEHIYQVGPERATQDNFGVRIARGEIVWVTGSDFRMDLDYIEQGVKKIQEGYDAIYMSVLTDRYVQHYWGRVKALERRCYIGDNTIESARFFKKSVWEKLGGFDEKLLQIEEDFQHRIDSSGYKTGRIKAREYHMHEEESLLRVFFKSAYYGYFMRHYLQKHKGRAIKQLFPIRLAFLRNWKLLLKNPFTTFGLIVYKVVQYSAGIWGLKYSWSQKAKSWL